MQQKDKKQYMSYEQKEHAIIDLLLKFRHVSQTQFQELLYHKAHERIRITLNELADSGYIIRNFEKNLTNSPATYCLGKKAIQYLRSQGTDRVLLKRLYDEPTHTEVYQEHCILIASLYLSLSALLDGSDASLYFRTKTDMYNIRYLILPHPDAYIYISYPDGEKLQYFLDVFDSRAFMYKRVYQYLTYYKKKYWQIRTKTNFPEILFICPNEATLRSIYKFIQNKTSYDAPVFNLTTKDKVKKSGLHQDILTRVCTF